MWPYIWIGFMLALVISMIVAGVREAGARKKAMANMEPQPLDMGQGAAQPAPSGPVDAFGNPVDSFGTGGDDFGGFDDNAFK
ncbi:MAG: hypothetical protein AAF483_00135 [Planctomycetota bacterium]